MYSEYAGFKGCECLPNYYRLDRFGACKRCPLRGLTCQNETVSLQPVISLLATFVTMNVGMLLKIPAEEAYSSGLVQLRDSMFVSVVLVAVNVTVVGLIVGKQNYSTINAS